MKKMRTEKEIKDKIKELMNSEWGDTLENIEKSAQIRVLKWVLGE